MKPMLLRAACAAFAFYFRRVPGRIGKAWLWRRVVRPYLAWRPITVRIRTDGGFVLDGRIDNLIHCYLYFFGRFEPALAALLRRSLRPGDVMVDVGANVGAHTLLASRLVGPQGRVHAIEASPTIFQTLQATLLANGCSNVMVHNVAATDRAGSVRVYLHDDSNLGMTTIVESEAGHRPSRLEAEVPGLPLPAILPAEDLRAARLIKIDVEGAEWLVIGGLQPALADLRPDVEIVVEVAPRALAGFGQTLESFLAIFHAAGFEALDLPHSYSAEAYLDPEAPEPVPFSPGEIEQADLLFRRRRTPAAPPPVSGSAARG